VLLTGDGGWAGLDQELAERLAARGVPVVGFNSLKYFRTERTPEEAATAAAMLAERILAFNEQKPDARIPSK
jgi:type IV secretory pathway VirJ component